MYTLGRTPVRCYLGRWLPHLIRACGTTCLRWPRLIWEQPGGTPCRPDLAPCGINIHKVKDKFKGETYRIVIESIALSTVNYCLPIYGTTNNTLLRRMQQIPTFAAKICSGGVRSDQATPFTTQLQLLKIDQQSYFWCFSSFIQGEKQTLSWVVQVQSYT